MRIETPFNGVRKQTLYRYYGVTIRPKYEPGFQVTGATLRRLFFLGVLATFFVWWIF